MSQSILEHRGWLFVIFAATFPRITLAVSSVVSGGVMWWLGWLFAPHLLVAFLAIPYWHTDPWLVFFAWSTALAGTKSEVSSTRLFKRR